MQDPAISREKPFELRNSNLEICRSSQCDTQDKLLLPPATERPTLYAKLGYRVTKIKFPSLSNPAPWICPPRSAVGERGE